MSVRSKIFVVVLAIVANQNLGAEIGFSSKSSALVVNDGSWLNFASASPMINKGTLNNTGLGTIQGSPVFFNDGTYTFFHSVSNVSGTLDTNQNIINLGNDPATDGDTMIANPGGLQGASINVYAGSNLLRGQPLFFGPNDLIFPQPVVGLLGVAVQNTLCTNITLNDGVIVLQDDLRLGDGNVVLDDGSIVLNGRRLSIGGLASTWNGQIDWFSAEDIQLNSEIVLNGVWGFFGNNQINGNGNVIDLSNGGSIVVGPASTLNLAGLQIIGLGAGNINLAPDAQLILSDVNIEMVSDYNIDSGTVIIQGSSTVITKNFLLSFVPGPAGANGKLIVKDVSLTYDCQGTIDQLNIRPQLINDPMRINVDVQGGGDIRTYKEDPITSQNYVNNALIQKYAIVAPYRQFVVFPTVNPDQSISYDVALDGNTNFLGFTLTEESSFVISPNVHVTATNIVFRDFSPMHVNFQANSSLVFGDNSMITLARNETLNYTWYFQGSSILRGSGQILNLGPNGAIVVQGTGSQLLLDGVILKGVNGTNVRCTDNSNSIIIKDVKWVQTGDFSFSTGGIQLLDDWTMLSPYNFTYSSIMPIQIMPSATWSLIRDQVFTYAPISGNQNLIQFADSTAAFLMDEATLNTVPGVLLDVGRFVVRDANFISGNIQFGPNLTLDQPAGATLQPLS